MKIGTIASLASIILVVVLSFSGQLLAATLISSDQPAQQQCKQQGCPPSAVFTDACNDSGQAHADVDCVRDGLMYVNAAAPAAAGADSAKPPVDEGKLSIPGSFLASVLAIIGIVAVARRDVSARSRDSGE
ncbi:MAG: hypothetical protein ACR2RB_01260 [Gammaproteobacteria bacterium]